MKAITNPNAQYRIPIEVFVLMTNEPLPKGVKLGKWAYGYFDSERLSLDRLQFTVPGMENGKFKWVEVILSYGNEIMSYHHSARKELKRSIRKYRANNRDIESLQRTDI